MIDTKRTWHYVGSDVSKDTLDVSISGGCVQFTNDSAGLNLLRASLKKHATSDAPLVVFEASGDYERALRKFLRKHGCE